MKANGVIADDARPIINYIVTVFFNVERKSSDASEKTITVNGNSRDSVSAKKVAQIGSGNA